MAVSATVHGFTLERFGPVTSTQDLLRARVAAGEDVSLVAARAREQTAGRGRRGTPWDSTAGGSYQSLGLPAACVSPLLPLALGIGVAEALTRAGAATLVKWPNDLVSASRKLGGILVEVVSGVPVVGIGVNVGNAVPPQAAALVGWDVDVVGDLVLEGVARGVDLLKAGATEVVPRFAAVDWLRDRSVMIVGATGAGTGLGVDDQGRLKLAGPTGEVMTFGSGHVESVDGVRWGTP